MVLSKLDLKTRKCLLWVLLLLNMAVIFALSSQPAEISTEGSDILVALPQLLFEKAHPEMAGSEAVYLVIQFIIRKTAHVMEFATLSALAAELLRLYEKRYAYSLGALFAMVYAITDELHQTFIPGRDGKISDWCFDTLGAVLGVVALWLILRCWRRRKHPREGTMENKQSGFLGAVRGFFARLQGIPDKYLNSVYYVAFTCILVQQFIFLTKFQREPFQMLYIIGTLLAGIVAGFRWLKQVGKDNLYCVASVVILAVGGGYFLVRHSYYFLVLALLVVGARDVRARKLLIIYCAVSCVMISANLISFFLAGGQFVKARPGLDFGSINTTDFQGMLFFLLIPYLMLRYKRITYMELFAWLGIVVFFWEYTFAENNLYCSLLAIAVALAYRTFVFDEGAGPEKALKGHRETMRKALRFMPVLCFIVFGIIMILLVARYDPASEQWVRLDRLLHSRLHAPHSVYTAYPPNLWGSEFTVVGWGYTPGLDINEMYATYGYTYIDSSYPNILIMHGILVYCAIIAGLTFTSFRYHRNKYTYFVLLLAVIALDCCAEGHLKEIECVPFLVFPFAELWEKDERTSEVLLR